MTREALAQFIEEVASGNYLVEDWKGIAVNHYSDTVMEEARRELVRYVGGHKEPRSASFENQKEALLDVARRLRDSK